MYDNSAPPLWRHAGSALDTSLTDEILRNMS